MLRANKPSKEEMIELLIFNKEDIEMKKIDFRWIHSREFKFNGDMYDIITKNETDDQLIVYVINDTKEKKLEEEFDKRVHKNSTEDKNNRQLSKNLISISEPIQNDQTKSKLICKSMFWNFMMESYKSYLPEIPVPPPRSISVV